MEQTIPVVVARIAKPHGIRGEVVLDSFTDVEGRLEERETFLLMNRGSVIRTVEVESRRFFNGRHVLQFRGISGRTEAEKLRGMELGIPEEEIGSLPENQYFVHDLIGMTVRLKNGEEIGVVKDVVSTGGVDLLEIGSSGEILIPFADPICVNVDPKTRQITVDPPEGLLKLNES
jgi:16S rRNA processing protein RimM